MSDQNSQPHSHFEFDLGPPLGDEGEAQSLKALVNALASDLNRASIGIGHLHCSDRAVRIDMKGAFSPMRIECRAPSEDLPSYICQVMPIGPKAWRGLRRVRITEPRERLVRLLEEALARQPGVLRLSSWSHAKGERIRSQR